MQTAILEEIGLSKNEAKVYTALLDLVSASAGPIIEKAEIPHSKVYPVLDRLIEKGLAPYVLKGNVRYYQPSPPQALVDYLEQKKKAIAQQQGEVRKIIPQFAKKKKELEGKQSAAVFEGIQGVKNAMYMALEELKRGEEYLVFALGEELMEKQLVIFFKNLHHERVQRGITLRIIVPRKIKEGFLKSHVYPKMEYRFTDTGFPTGVRLFKNKVITMVWGEKPTAIVVESRQLAENYRKFFEDLWRKSRKE